MPPTCPSCGYTKEDAQIHGDHHLCKNSGNAPWERNRDVTSTPAPDKCWHETGFKDGVYEGTYEDWVGRAFRAEAEAERLRSALEELLPFVERRRVNLKPCPSEACGHESCNLVRNIEAELRRMGGTKK